MILALIKLNDKSTSGSIENSRSLFLGTLDPTGSASQRGFFSLEPQNDMIGTVRPTEDREQTTECLDLNRS